MKGFNKQRQQGPQPVKPSAPPARPSAPQSAPVAVKPTTPTTAAELPEVVDGEAPVVEEERPEGYTPQEGAQVLGGEKAGFSGKSVRRHIRNGTCPATKHQGRWYVTEEQLTVYLDNLEKLKATKAAKEAAEAAKAAADDAQIELPTTS